MKALIVGYYNHNNFGDDMYMLSFPSVLNKASLEFVKIDELNQKDWRDYDLVVLGGGDIMCPYFLNKFKNWHYQQQPQIPCHAYSFGMPFPELLKEGHLDMFDYFICRNKDDSKVLKERFGNEYVEYLPDFVFAEIVPNTLPLHKKSKKAIVSLFPASPCLNDKIIRKLATFIEQYKDFYDFVAYPLDTNPSNKMNDFKISQEIQKYAPSLQIHQGPYTFEAVLTLLHNSYISICVRLHSHIFSIMTGTPFISLFSTRKVRNLLDDFNLNDLGTPMYIKCEYCKQTTQPPLSQSLVVAGNDKLPGCPSCRQMCGKPVDFNLDDLLKLHQNVIKHHRRISQNLLTIAVTNYQLLTTASHRLPSMVKRESPPVFVDSRTIVDQKKGLSKEIVNYMNKSFDADNKLGDDQINDEADNLLKGRKLISDIYRETSKKKYSPNQLKDLESEITDLISYKLSGKVRPDFHYGLSKKIGQPDYNLNESLDYLIKHQFQKYGKTSEIVNHTSKFNMHKINQEKLEHIHYSGWNYVVNHLYMKMHNPDGIMLNAFLDRTFHWEYNFNLKMGLIPYKEPWVGFLHHALDTKYSDYNCQVLFTKPAFLESLKECKGIYVFSRYLRDWVRNALQEHGYGYIRVDRLIHPTETPQIKFNFYKFRNNRFKSIIQIGGWYRNSYAIYELETRLHKIALKGSGNDNYFKPSDFDFDNILEIGAGTHNLPCDCTGPCGHPTGSGHTKCCGHQGSGHQGSGHQGSGHQGSGHSDSVIAPYKNNKYLVGMVDMLKKKDESVQIFENIDNLSYDHLLSQNIVFLNLVDCSVSNTVIECIVRNTPLLINRHPAVEELLGRRYPFYYRNFQEATRKSDDMYLIQLTHFYLKSLNKTVYEMSYFIRSIQRSKIHRSIRLPSEKLFEPENLFQPRNLKPRNLKSRNLKPKNLSLNIQDDVSEDHDYDSDNQSPTSFEV